MILAEPKTQTSIATMQISSSLGYRSRKAQLNARRRSGVTNINGVGILLFLSPIRAVFVHVKWLQMVYIPRPQLHCKTSSRIQPLGEFACILLLATASSHAIICDHLKSDNNIHSRKSVTTTICDKRECSKDCT
jgi:hypothetical protein